MPTERQVYTSEAERYEALISREDYQHNIEHALDGIQPVDGLDVIDLGAGTGRLAVPLAARARTMRAFDISHHMLTVTRDKFRKLAPGPSTALRHSLRSQRGDSRRVGSQAAVADHRYLPAASASADLIISGWSVSYLAVWNPERWREELDGWMKEVRRVLRPGGTVILLESLGTGNETPVKLDHLANFYPWLDEAGFQGKWIRTDYRFESLDEAVELAEFFFGEEMGARVRKERLVVLPECTGVYWLKT
ncbi:MAG: class I SAM-dependent methyltransferase [Gammaproteobacteria bacterium]